MGESYRGLTIKIGGDTTGLSKALKSVNASIRQTQSELRKINQGLKLDPTSAKLVGSKVAELGQKAQQASAKLATMRKAMEQLKGTEVERVAKSARNLALEAENARARYARVDEELARLHNSFEQIARANKVAFDRNDMDGSIANMRELGLLTDEQIAKLNELKAAHHAAFADNEVKKQALQYKDLAIEIQRAEAEVSALNAEQAKLKSDSWASQRSDVRRLKSELESLDGTAGTLARQFKVLQASMAMNPSSALAVKAVYDSLSNQIATAKERQAALNAAISKMRASGIDVASADAKSLAESARAAQQEFQDASNEVAKTTAKLQLAKQAAIELESAAGKGSAEYRRQADEVNSLTAKLNALVAEQKAAGNALTTARSAQELQELTVKAQAAGNAVSELEAKQKALGAASGVSASALKSLGMTAYATVSPAFMALGYKSVEAADRIDSAFRDMKKTVNGTEQDFENLRQAALRFSRTNAVSSDTILEIEAMGGQLGIAVDNLQDFGTVVSNLDISTNMNADEIAEQLGQLNNILPDLNDNYTAFGDSVVRLGNNMPAQESAIMDVTSRIASLGGIVGMSTPQVLSWATAIAATGQNSEAAGTAISNTMSDIEGAVAGGGAKLESFAKVAGMSATDFAKAWSETPSDAMKSFVEGLHSIDEQGGSVDKTLQDLGITGVRQKQALEGLAQTTDVLNSALTMSQDAWNGVSDEWGAAGDAAREASQKSEGFSGTLQILKNSASELGYELGNALVPFMQAGTAAVQGITDGFKQLPGPVKDAAVAVGLLGAGSGTLITLYSSLSPLLKNGSKNLMKQVAYAQATGNAYKIMGVDIAAANAKLKSMVASEKVATGSTKALAASMKLLKGGATIVGFVGLDILVEQAGKAYERFTNLNQATNGLKSAVAGINTTSASNSLASIGEYAAKATMSFDDFVKSQAELANSIKDSNAQVAATKGQLSEYDATIQQLNGTTDSGADGAGRLKAAVEGVNQACGTNYEVVKNAAGNYVVMKDGAEQASDAIHKLVEAQKLQAETEALQQQYKDLYNTKAEAARQYADQLNEVQRAQKANDDAIAAGLPNSDEYGRQLAAANEELKKRKDALDSASGAMDKVSQQESLLAAATMDGASANTQYAASSDELKAALMNASGSSTDFIKAMDDAGVSLKELGDSNQDALMQIASSWDGNMSSVLQKVDELGDQVPQGTRDAVNKAAAEMLNASPYMVSAAANACNMTSSEFFKLAQSTGLSGDQAMDAFISGIQSGQSPSAAAAAAVASSAKGNLDGLKSGASSAGSAGASAFSSAIRGKSGEAGSAGSSVANAAKSPMQNSKNGASGWGSDLASNFASGIRAGIGLVGSAAKAIADAAASVLHFSEPDKGPWSGAEHGGITSGRHLAQNFANGIVLGVPDVYKATVRMADSANAAIAAAGIDPTVNVKAVITELSAANGLAVDPIAVSADAAASYAAACSASAALPATASSTTNVYQVQQSGAEDAVVQWLDRNLPQIIANYTPVIGERDFNRKVRAAI